MFLLTLKNYLRFYHKPFSIHPPQITSDFSPKTIFSFRDHLRFPCQKCPLHCSPHIITAFVLTLLSFTPKRPFLAPQMTPDSSSIPPLGSSCCPYELLQHFPCSPVCTQPPSPSTLCLTSKGLPQGVSWTGQTGHGTPPGASLGAADNAGWNSRHCT